MATSRDLAAELLLRLDRKGDRVKNGLDEARSKLTDSRERGLLTELAYGTVRRQGTLDALIGAFSKRPVPRLNAALRTALRLAAYQLFFLDRIPNHAAVDHAVGWATKHAGARRAGFVNGVIRNLIRGIEGPATGPEVPRRDVPRDDGSAVRMKQKVFASPETNLAGNLAARFSMPQWIVERWLALWGEARVAEILRNAIARPSITLRARESLPVLEATLSARNVEFRAGPGPLALRVRDGEAAVNVAVRTGKAAVQDATSQRVVPLLALQAGERVLDLCAAPGGKTLQIADELGTGHIAACDVVPLKLRGLEELKPLLGAVGYEVVQLDPAGVLPFELASFDAILVDAPCTNTGVYGRRVEARWRAKPGDTLGLAAIQGRLLDRAIRVLKPGGRLVYSTCSVEPAENEEVLAAFLERHPAFSGEVAFRAWPTLEHDGGFAALLRAP